MVTSSIGTRLPLTQNAVTTRVVRSPPNNPLAMLAHTIIASFKLLSQLLHYPAALELVTDYCHPGSEREDVSANAVMNISRFGYLPRLEEKE